MQIATSDMQIQNRQGGCDVPNVLRLVKHGVYVGEQPSRGGGGIN
jgi:hypothetical protein